jgi:putative ABC transport system permease protein
MFSLVRGILFQALPFPDADRLVEIQTLVSDETNRVAYPSDVSYPDFLDWKQQSRSVEAMASYSYGASSKFRAPLGSQSRIIPGTRVSADFFKTLGVSPMIGRTFTEEDERPGARSMIISYGLWMSDFAGSPSVVGSQVKLSDLPYTVIGVMPADFKFPFQNPLPSYWETFARLAEGPGEIVTRRDRTNIQVLCKLKMGVTVRQLAAEMNVIQKELASVYLADREIRGVKVSPLLDYIGVDVSGTLYLLFGMVSSLLLICCVNVAGLVLARGFARRSEFALRVALGANPFVIARQVLVECTFLGSFAGAVGIGLAFFLLKLLLALVPRDVPRLEQVGIDIPTLVFTLLLSISTGLLFGLIPAWNASLADSQPALRRGGRGVGDSKTMHRIQGGLVIAEIGVSLVLLASCSVLLHSFLSTVHVHPGFDPSHTLVFRLGMSNAMYSADKKVRTFKELTPQLLALPGAESVTGGYPIPFTSEQTAAFQIQGHVADPTNPSFVSTYSVEPNYFETLRIPVVQGRTFTERDAGDSKRVAIIDEEFARTFLSGETPLGKYVVPQLSGSSQKPVMYEVVGMVRSIRTSDLTQTPAPALYLPYRQTEEGLPWTIMRVTGDPRIYIKSVLGIVSNFDNDLPVFDVRTMQEVVTASTIYARFEILLVLGFSISSLLLAATGLYAALSELVARRTSEIGLRVALGAQRNAIFVLVIRRGLFLAAAGLFGGITSFAITTRYLFSGLYGVTALDPFSVAVATFVVLIISVVASAVPAFRAVTVQPMDALRSSD